jgi:hypothetical protein
MAHPAQQQSQAPGPCDPTKITELTCGSERVERQAAVTEENKERLDGYRASFATARADYTTAWKTAEDDRKAARTTLDKLLKELRCRLDEDTETCLDRVWGAVEADLDRCVSQTEGCRVAACNPDESVSGDVSPGVLAGRISDLRDQAERHEKYFTELLAEITELPDRAAAAKEEVTQLETDVRGSTSVPTPAGSGSGDVVALVARALVADWRLKHVRGGFDSIDAFLDCLCRALTAVLRTWAAIVKLEGEKAYRTCIEGADGGSCTVLLADPLAALIDRFTKECRGKEPSSAC